MTYFEIFGIPVQLRVNAAALSRRFFELSRQYHPDYYATATPAEQEAALERSALLNKAWKTFQQPDETLKYVLAQKGLLAEEEKYDLSPLFLAEVMEINEALMDADDPAVQSELHTRINELQQESYAPVQHIIEQYHDETVTTEQLMQVKEYYYRKKYLERIRRQLAGMV